MHRDKRTIDSVGFVDDGGVNMKAIAADRFDAETIAAISAKCLNSTR
jgi:hypothetical protein